MPNLGQVDAPFIKYHDKSVFNGPAQARGMPGFIGKLTSDDAQKIKAFIQGRAGAIRPGSWVRVSSFDGVQHLLPGAVG